MYVLEILATEEAFRRVAESIWHVADLVAEWARKPPDTANFGDPSPISANRRVFSATAPSDRRFNRRDSLKGCFY